MCGCEKERDREEREDERQTEFAGAVQAEGASNPPDSYNCL